MQIHVKLVAEAGLNRGGLDLSLRAEARCDLIAASETQGALFSEEIEVVFKAGDFPGLNEATLVDGVFHVQSSENDLTKWTGTAEDFLKFDSGLGATVEEWFRNRDNWFYMYGLDDKPQIRCEMDFFVGGNAD